VGVDNVDDQKPAIEWAAIRAHSGGTSLRIVHAYQWPVAIDPLGLAVWLETAPVASALAVVDDAVRHARAVVPGLDVETRLRPTSPAAALLREGKRAELIVVGRSKRSRFWPWVLTVNDELVRRARGRVVVVDDKEEDFF
jgi:nucleotide-binding universal stress UspA family protein